MPGTDTGKIGMLAPILLRLVGALVLVALPGHDSTHRGHSCDGEDKRSLICRIQQTQ